jgi:hypothetical protein
VFACNHAAASRNCFFITLALRSHGSMVRVMVPGTLSSDSHAIA